MEFHCLRKTIDEGSNKMFMDLLNNWRGKTKHGVPQGPNGETPLHLVCAANRPYLAKQLLGLGSRKVLDYTSAFRMYETTMGFTPFLTAAMAGCSECFEVLFTKFVQLLQTNYFDNYNVVALFTCDKEKKKYYRLTNAT
jgi:hypothetical protein